MACCTIWKYCNENCSVFSFRCPRWITSVYNCLHVYCSVGNSANQNAGRLFYTWSYCPKLSHYGLCRNYMYVHGRTRQNEWLTEDVFSCLLWLSWGRFCSHRSSVQKVLPVCKISCPPAVSVSETHHTARTVDNVHTVCCIDFVGVCVFFGMVYQRLMQPTCKETVKTASHTHEAKKGWETEIKREQQLFKCHKLQESWRPIKSILHWFSNNI